MRVVYFHSGKRKLPLPLLPATVALIFLAAAVLVCSGVRTRPVLAEQLPLTGCRFVLDAGHGGFDGGAKSPSGTTEAPLNLKVASYLQKELETLGAEVIMTRTDDEALADTKKADMEVRRQIIAQEGMTAAVSIHMNNFTTSGPCGPRVFFWESSEQGRALAVSLQNALDDACGFERKEPLAGDYMVLRSGSNTCVLVECGFLSNPTDEALLKTAAHQKLLAKTIADVLCTRYGAQEDLPSMAKELCSQEHFRPLFRFRIAPNFDNTGICIYTILRNSKE